ncbi:LAS1-like protein [Arachis hypogaea]|nr:LAS1-like protein [Arachis hypogaea]
MKSFSGISLSTVMDVGALFLSKQVCRGVVPIALIREGTNTISTTTIHNRLGWGLAGLSESIVELKSVNCLLLHLVKITTSFVEIQQKDPCFRVESGESSLLEDILSMFYCMAIMSL